MITGGILFMPKGFMFGGWVFTVVCYFSLGIINTICMLWLARAGEKQQIKTFELISLHNLGIVGY